jgi:hypothetical protein
MILDFLKASILLLMGRLFFFLAIQAMCALALMGFASSSNIKAGRRGRGKGEYSWSWS